MFVAFDGDILNILGSIFSNAENKDANILISEFQWDFEDIRNWFQNGDIFIIDRRYRDSIPILQGLSINIQMADLIQRGQSQLITEEANASKIVTKTRWLVETLNGHLKQYIQDFQKIYIVFSHLPNVREFLLICAVILNKYYPPLTMPGATIELARQMIERSLEPNVVQTRVEQEGLQLRRGECAT